MQKERKIAIVARRIPLSQEGEDDILFWAAQTPKARLEEAERLRVEYHIWKDGFYPEHITKVVSRRKLK